MTEVLIPIPEHNVLCSSSITMDIGTHLAIRKADIVGPKALKLSKW